jgi:hypothetical protein
MPDNGRRPRTNEGLNDALGLEDVHEVTATGEDADTCIVQVVPAHGLERTRR